MNIIHFVIVLSLGIRFGMEAASTRTIFLIFISEYMLSTEIDNIEIKALKASDQESRE